MADPHRPRSIADMPAQHPMAPATPAEARGRFFNTGNGFNVQLPPVPDRIFTAEPARALDPATPTGLIACDISADLACRFPATTPLVLAHYAKIRAGETLTTDFVASGVIAYVITRQRHDAVRGPGDRAGTPATCSSCPAASRRCMPRTTPMPCCGSSPTSRNLAFENLRAPARGAAPTETRALPRRRDRAADRAHLRGRSQRSRSPDPR